MRIAPSTIMKTVTLFVFTCLLVWSLAQPAVVSAQQAGSVVIDTLRVDVWPEYDQPSVLVIMNITLASQTSLPANMSIRIPASAGKPYAVAMQDPNGLYNLNYELAAAGDWVEVKFTAPVPDVRVEYYDPSLAKDGAQRDYTFRWAGDYEVNNLSVSVQQPFNATDMTFLPALGAGAQGKDGLTYHTLAAGKVNSGTPLELSMKYQKPDDVLTNSEEFQAAQPQQPVNENTTGRVMPNQMVPWIIGGFGLLLIGAGVFWYMRTGRAPAPAETGKKRHNRSSRAASAVSTPESHGEAVFCHQCGKKAGPGDAFCRACGTKLR